jgi:isoquinoline 1-oxidoreductase beta subunit
MKDIRPANSTAYPGNRGGEASPGIGVTTRRGFLDGVFSTGALVLGVEVRSAKALAADNTHSAFQPSIFLAIETDGSVMIMAHRSEMGQGVRTSLPMIVADELDADWSRVRIEQAPGDPRYGPQDTNGSKSLRDFFRPMREIGAAARWMLIRAAARKWDVPPAECISEIHTVVHRPSGRRLGYGELATLAAQIPVPKREELEFKAKAAWRYIGKSVPGKDLSGICAGTSVFGMDVRVDGMVYASIEHPPVFGGKVKSYEAAEALKIPGVRDVVAIEPFTPPAAYQPLGGLAVIADNTWSAFRGREKLKITWEHGPNATYNSTAYKEQLRQTVHQPAKVLRNVGDVDAAFSKGGKIIEADYYVPLLAQAPMEPMVAVADFRDGKVTVWAPVQTPPWAQDNVAKVLGIPKENVTCNVTLLGGGFGRKDQSDYVAEAAVLSRKTGRPVKVVWNHEDNIKFSYYNAVCAMYMKAALGSDGRPTGWLQRNAFPPIPSTFDGKSVYGDAGHLQQGWTDVPFDVANLRVENGPAEAHVRIGWMRSVASIYQVFAVQCFAAELAHAAGRDPYKYVLDLIGQARILDLKSIGYPNYGASPEVYPYDTGRLRHVAELVAEKAAWGKRRLGKRSGLGFAVNRNSVSYAAAVVEVEVTSSGQIRIPRVDVAMDAGTIVNPSGARAQAEGSVVFATSIVRNGQITATKGAIDQSGYGDYRIDRIDEAPDQTNVHFVDSDAPPSGMGEPVVPVVIPALCNAVFAATGKRIRDLPIGKQKLV